MSDPQPSSPETQRLARRRTRWGRWSVSLGSGLGVAALVCGLQALGLFDGLELESYDIRIRQMARPERAHRQIVTVMIGKLSVDFYARNDPVSGAWPWTRDYYEPVVRYCREAGARAIVFDMIFTEQSRAAEHDANLAAACRRTRPTDAPVIMVATFDKDAAKPVAVPERFRVPVAIEGATALPSYGQVNLPFGPLSEGISGIGDAYLHPEGDASTGRRIQLLCRYGDGIYPSLAFAAYLEVLFPGYFDKPLAERPVLRLDRRHRLAIPAVPPVRIPLDDEGRMLVHFRGPERYTPRGAPPSERKDTYRRHEICDVIGSWDIRKQREEGKADLPPERVPAESLKDKIVLIGADAPGLDTKSGPFLEWPGALFHAAALDTLLQRDALVRWRRGTMLAVTAGLALAVTLLASSRSIAFGALGTLALLAGYAAFTFAAIPTLDAWVEVVAPLCAGVLAYGATATANFFLEGRDTLFVKHAFQHFVPASVVHKIIQNPESLRLGGEKRELTIFFSDLAGFTSLSEVLAPEALFGTLNEYLDRMTEVIHGYEGTLDKYVGDAIVAFWNAPERQADHAVRACRAALANQKELQTFRDKLRMSRLPDFNARIGLNTDTVTVGFVGARKRFQYTVLGDGANLASRLEGANKAYGTSILISERTYGAARDAVLGREVDLLRVKGKQQPVRVYELVALAEEATDDQRKVARVFHEGLAYYRERRWADARVRFEAVLGMAQGDGPARAYLERCAHYEQDAPPADWDGVYTLKVK